MAERKKYYIRVPEALVEVSEEVYRAYHQEKRRGYTMNEKDQRNGLTSYDELDTDELTGQEMIPDRDAVSVEDTAIANIMRSKLHRCLALLPEGERTLLEKIYFCNQSEYKVAQTLGIPRMTVHNRKARALCKLKKMMVQ